MRQAFNLIMRIISTLLGLLLMAAGGIWVLQGTGLAFQVGFMAGDWHWTLYGALMVLVGVAQAVWSNTRQGRH